MSDLIHSYSSFSAIRQINQQTRIFLFDYRFGVVLIPIYGSRINKNLLNNHVYGTVWKLLIR